MRSAVDAVAKEVFQRSGLEVKFKFGTTLELPRAALLADQLAEEAEFFSFGTNENTQTTLGVSRDDAGSFLSVYVERQAHASARTRRISSVTVAACLAP